MPLSKDIAATIASLEALTRKATDADGLTMAEIQDEVKREGEAWSTSEARARRLVRAAIAAGEWEHAGQRTARGIDGRACRVPVYRPVRGRQRSRR